MAGDNDDDFPAATADLDPPTPGESEDIGPLALRGENSSTLDIYFNQVSKAPLMGREEEFEFAQAYAHHMGRLRDGLYALGYVASEHLTILADLRLGDVEKFFSANFDKRDGESAQDIFLDAKPWAGRITAALAAAEKAFDSGSSTQLASARAALKDTLLERSPSYEQLNEWWRLADMYRAAIRPLAALREPTEWQRIKLSYFQRRLLMKADEFLEAMAAMDGSRQSANDARARIVEANLRLVVNIVKRFGGRGVPLEDLIQEGNIGLMRAVDRFDHRKGHRLGTYAGWWIRLYARRALERQSRVIRIPVHMLEAINKLFHCEQAFIREKGREPSDREIASLLDVTEARVRALRKMAMQPISLQAHSASEEGGDLGELIPAESAELQFQEALGETLRNSIDKALANLSERERMILLMRYGLLDDRPRTLEEIAEHFMLSRERIRQIEMKSIMKIKRMASTRNAF